MAILLTFIEPLLQHAKVGYTSGLGEVETEVLGGGLPNQGECLVVEEREGGAATAVTRYNVVADGC